MNKSILFVSTVVFMVLFLAVMVVVALLLSTSMQSIPLGFIVWYLIKASVPVLVAVLLAVGFQGALFVYLGIFGEA